MRTWNCTIPVLTANFLLCNQHHFLFPFLLSLWSLLSKSYLSCCPRLTLLLCYSDCSLTSSSGWQRKQQTKMLWTESPSQFTPFFSLFFFYLFSDFHWGLVFLPHSYQCQSIDMTLCDKTESIFCCPWMCVCVPQGINQPQSGLCQPQLTALEAICGD